MYGSTDFYFHNQKTAKADVPRVALRKIVSFAAVKVVTQRFSDEKRCVTTLMTAAKETDRKSKDYQSRFCVIGALTTLQAISRFKCTYTNLQVFPFRGRHKLFYRYARNSYRARQHVPLHPPPTCEGIPTGKK